MHILMFLGGLISLAAGGAALGLGIVEHRAGGGAVLITPGTVGVVGGLALLGVGAIGARLSRLADMLETQPLPRSVAVTPDDPALREAAVAGANPDRASPAAAAAPQIAPVAAPNPAPPIPYTPPPPAREAAPAPIVASPAAPPVSPPQNVAPPVVAVAPAQAAPPPASAPEESAPHVLKSGVIEGMAYTLYSNGAVDAELPRLGTVRFASIAEWRAHIRGEQ
jgi:hypothetical protein